MVWLVVRSRRYTSVLPFVSAPSSGPSQVKATRLAVVADHRVGAVLVRRGACRPGPAADERDRAGQPVLHVDVEDGVVVLVAQPVRARCERDEAAGLVDRLGIAERARHRRRQWRSERRVAAEDGGGVRRERSRMRSGGADEGNGRDQDEQDAPHAADLCDRTGRGLMRKLLGRGGRVAGHVLDRQRDAGRGRRRACGRGPSAASASWRPALPGPLRPLRSATSACSVDGCGCCSWIARTSRRPCGRSSPSGARGRRSTFSDRP